MSNIILRGPAWTPYHSVLIAGSLRVEVLFGRAKVKIPHPTWSHCGVRCSETARMKEGC